MADEAELDLNRDGNISGDGYGVRKNIALKLKPSPKGKRGRKSNKQKKEELREEESGHNPGEYDEEVQLPILKGPLEPQHKNQKLHWDHKVHLIGERVVDPLIHCCENCALPILIYGRMIPCKHVFCLDCAKKAEKSCPRCSDAVQRIEQAALGTVFVCTHGGAKHGVFGCRRTYLSNRDLQAHVQYRHLREHTQQQQSAPVVQTQQQSGLSLNQQPAVSMAQQLAPQQAAPVLQQPQRQDYPAHSIAGVALTGVIPQQTGQQNNQTLPTSHPTFADQLRGLPQSFTSPPPTQTGVPIATHGLAPPQPGMVPSQGFHQPNSAPTLESYQTVSRQGAPNQMTAAGQPPGNLIPIMLQDEGGGYNTGVPPPGYSIQGAPPPRNYPPVSFAGTVGGPPPIHGGPPPNIRGGIPGHMPPRQGPPPQNQHVGIPPRFPPPGQNPPFSQQSGPGGPPPTRPGGGPRPWQGPGPCVPPPRGPLPPPNPRGPGPRY